MISPLSDLITSVNFPYSFSALSAADTPSLYSPYSAGATTVASSPLFKFNEVQPVTLMKSLPSNLNHAYLTLSLFNPLIAFTPTFCGSVTFTSIFCTCAILVPVLVATTSPVTVGNVVSTFISLVAVGLFLYPALVAYADTSYTPSPTNDILS